MFAPDRGGRAHLWLARYLVDGAAGLLDKSSRPEKSPRSIAPHVALDIVELRRKLCLQARIAAAEYRSRSTTRRSVLFGVGDAPGGHLDEQCAVAALYKFKDQLK